MGYENTSYYALIDGNTIHYVLLQLYLSENITVGSPLVPKEYMDFSDVEHTSFNTYE